MTREEAGRRGREIAARARVQKSEYYTDGNTVRHVKPQSRVTHPYISKDEVSTPMRCIAPIKVVSKTEQSSEKYLQELPVKGFVLEAVPLSSLEHKTDEPYADRANKGLFTKPPIHWQMMPKEYFGLRFAFKARA